MWNMWTFLSGSWWISWPCWCCPMCIFLRFCVLGITISLEVKWSRFGNKAFSWPLGQRGNFSTTKWTYPMIHLGIVSEDNQSWTSHHLPHLTLSPSVHHLGNRVQNLSESRLLYGESLLRLHKLLQSAVFGCDWEGISHLCHDCGGIFHFVNWHDSWVRWKYITFFAIYMKYNEEMVLINELFSSHRFWKDLGK